MHGCVLPPSMGVCRAVSCVWYGMQYAVHHTVLVEYGMRYTVRHSCWCSMVCGTLCIIPYWCSMQYAMPHVIHRTCGTPCGTQYIPLMQYTVYSTHTYEYESGWQRAVDRECGYIHLPSYVDKKRIDDT